MTYCEFWNVTSTDSHSGVFSITDVGSMELRESFALLPVSDIAGISFWAKDPNALFAVGYELFYSDDPDPALYLNFFLAPLTTSDWTYIDVTPNLTPGKQLVGISVSGYDRFPSTPTPRVFVDDITVTVSTPEPQSGYLILIGVVGTLVAARQQTPLIKGQSYARGPAFVCVGMSRRCDRVSSTRGLVPGARYFAFLYARSSNSTTCITRWPLPCSLTPA
jgi:hypothetical protein